MSQPPPHYGLDTSALLTLIEDEAGADDVQALLEQAKRGEINLFISFISFMEVYYVSLQECGQEEAHERTQLMAALPCYGWNQLKPLPCLRDNSKPLIVFPSPMPGLLHLRKSVTPYWCIKILNSSSLRQP